jgi:hypothetical protein
MSIPEPDSQSSLLTLVAGGAAIFLLWIGARNKKAERGENLNSSTAQYALARVVNRFIFWISPGGYTLTGDEGWTGVTRAATGAETYAPTIIYPNSWSSSHRKKVVYLQQSRFTTESQNRKGGYILFTV